MKITKQDILPTASRYLIFSFTKLTLHQSILQTVNVVNVRLVNLNIWLLFDSYQLALYQSFVSINNF